MKITVNVARPEEDSKWDALQSFSDRAPRMRPMIAPPMEAMKRSGSSVAIRQRSDHCQHLHVSKSHPFDLANEFVCSRNGEEDSTTQHSADQGIPQTLRKDEGLVAAARLEETEAKTHTDPGKIDDVRKDLDVEIDIDQHDGHRDKCGEKKKRGAHTHVKIDGQIKERIRQFNQHVSH